MKLMKTIFAAVLTASAAAGVYAQPAPAAPDPAAIEAANRMLDVLDYEKLTQRTLDALVTEAQRTLPQRLEASSGRTLPADLKKRLGELLGQSVTQTFQRNKAELKRGTALIYARHFTAAELAHLTKLQSDPVMRRMQLQMPQIAAETLALTQAALEKERPQLLADIRKLIAEHMGEDGGS